MSFLRSHLTFIFRIVEIAARQPYLQEKIPKVYLKLLEVLKQRRKRVKQPFISWKHFREWGVIADEAQLRRATELLHDWGELLCFSKPKQLQDLVRIRDSLVIVITNKKTKNHPFRLLSILNGSQSSSLPSFVQ